MQGTTILTYIPKIKHRESKLSCLQKENEQITQIPADDPELLLEPIPVKIIESQNHPIIRWLLSITSCPLVGPNIMMMKQRRHGGGHEEIPTSRAEQNCSNISRYLFNALAGQCNILTWSPSTNS